MNLSGGLMAVDEHATDDEFVSQIEEILKTTRASSRAVRLSGL
jgi:hypothetical protein